MIKDGDYVLENGVLLQCDFIDELLQSAACILNTRRGAFYPDRRFGSYLFALGEEPLGIYAAAYARQALGGIDGVFVQSAAADETTVTVNLAINGKERQVVIDR